MKIAILLFIALIGACSAGYSKIPSSKYADHPLIPKLQEYGINYALGKAVASGNIDNKNFQVQTITSISYKSTSSFLYYKFELVLTNAKNQVLTLVSEVRYCKKAGSLYNKSYDYKVKSAVKSTPSDGYVAVPQSEYTSDLIKSLINHGKDYIISQGINNGKIPAGTYTVKKIVSAYKQTVSTGANYQFELYIENSDGTRKVEATFTLSYKAPTGAKSVKSYRYTTATIAPTPIDPTPSDPTDDFVDIPKSEYSTALFKSLVDHGTNYVISQGISKGKIPEGTYLVENIVSAKRQAMSNGANYQFEIYMENVDGTRNVVATFTLSYKSATGAKSVKSYRYTTTTM